MRKQSLECFKAKIIIIFIYILRYFLTPKILAIGEEGTIKKFPNC